MFALLSDLVDLVLPASCAGCGAEGERLRFGACAACARVLEGLRPFHTSPSPRPPGMPPCVAVGPYADELRSCLLAYKERGRRSLARPLGALLATAVAELAPRDSPVLLVPVPSTAAAARERLGDHMARLTAHTVRRLRDAGWEAEATSLLRALPRADSASLSVSERVTEAESSLRIRGGRSGFRRRETALGATLVVVDDIVTSGSTLAAVTRRLAEVNMQVTGAAVLAATRLRRRPARRSVPMAGLATEKAERRPSGIPNEG